MQVSYIHRAAGLGYSIERLFDSVRSGLPHDVVPSVHTAPFAGTSPRSLLGNCRWSRKRQGQINHVTGDAHYLTLSLPRRRTVLTIHDCVVLNRLTGWRRLVLYWLWYRLPIWKAGAITTISEEAKRELLSRVPVSPERVHVVPNCVGNEFQSSSKTPFPEQPVILQLGTKSNKNLENVAEALRGLRCTLRIVGRLTELQQTKLHECGIDYTSAAGLSDEEMRREYEECDVVVFASTYEGFGMPILEAQAVGRPLVTSMLPPMCDVAGQDACLVDPSDPKSIRDSLDRIIREPARREELIQQGLENVKAYRPEYVATQYVEIYRNLLERGGKRQ